MNKKIFLSFSAEDRVWVKVVADELKNRGVEIWADFYFEAGFSSINMAEIIKDALRASEIFVVFFSERSVRNNNVFFEIGAAVAGNKRIIPVLIGDIEYENTPFVGTKYQCIKEVSPMAAAEQLMKSIASEKQASQDNLTPFS